MKVTLICQLKMKSFAFFVCAVVVVNCFGYSQAGVNRLFEGLPNPPRFDLSAFPIMPGTYWCGNGNMSQSEEDLGLIAKTDKCCRAHDMCPDGIAAGKYKHGLHNTGWYTRSHCNCDNEFFSCLKEAGNPLSIGTGNTYFTVLGPQCFKQSHPITDCKVKRLGRCIEYAFDESQPEVWQWFDNPTFV